MNTTTTSSEAAVTRFSRKQLIVTGPEGVPLAFTAASLPERAAAWLLDMLVLYAITAAIGVLVFVIGLATSLLADVSLGMMINFFGLAHAVIFVVQQFYFPFFELRWRGATVGKRALGIRVVAASGRGLTLDAIFARNLVRSIELFLPIAILFGGEQIVGDVPWWLRILILAWLLLVIIMPLITREKTRVGDIVGGTLVVRVPNRIEISDVADRAQTQVHSFTFTSKELSYYGEYELEMLANVLRSAEKGSAPFSEVQRVAMTIAKRIDYDPESVASNAVTFLRAFYVQQREALERKLLFGKRKESKFDDR